MLYFVNADFFLNIFFVENFLSKIMSECQAIWTLIRLDGLSGLIWVQIVCNVYQKTALVLSFCLTEKKSFRIILVLNPLCTEYPFSAAHRSTDQKAVYLSCHRRLDADAEKKINTSSRVFY